MIKIRNLLQSSWLILTLCRNQRLYFQYSVVEDTELSVCGLAVLYFSLVMHLNNFRSGQAIYI